MHSLKSRNVKWKIFKIYISKSYDRFSWLYIHMLLTHLGFEVPFIKWVMFFITSVSFSILINGSASFLFHPERGLRQGCPLYPLIFLLIVESLSRGKISWWVRGYCDISKFKHHPPPFCWWCLDILQWSNGWCTKVVWYLGNVWKGHMLKINEINSTL